MSSLGVDCRVRFVWSGVIPILQILDVISLMKLIIVFNLIYRASGT